MFTNLRTCPESSRKCLLIAGKRCSISPSKSGSVSELHSMFCTPSVNRRSAEGISTVIFISLCFPDCSFMTLGSLLISGDGNHAIVDEILKDREAGLDRGRECVFLRNRINRFQAVAGNAGDRRLAGMDGTLPEQLLRDG